MSRGGFVINDQYFHRSTATPFGLHLPKNQEQNQIVEEKLVIDTASVIERKQFDPSQVIKG